jgi:hypothetical protein
MRRNQTLLALGLMVCAVLACRSLKDFSKGPKLYEGLNMQNAIAAFKEKAGGPVTALKLDFTNEWAILHARNPQGHGVDKYQYVGGVCKGPEPTEKLEAYEQLEDSGKYAFSLDDVNFAATPEIVKNAVARTEIDRGEVTHITIRKDYLKRPEDSPKIPVLSWRLEVGQFNSTAQVVTSAQGEIVGVDLSHTERFSKQNYLDTNAVQKAIQEIKRSFGGRVYIAELSVTKLSLDFLAATSPASDELQAYSYNLNGVARNDSSTLSHFLPKSRKPHEFLFSPDDIDFGMTNQVMKMAISKFGGEEPVVYSMSFSRARVGPTEAAGRIKWEVVVMDFRPGHKNTSIYFDPHGVFQEKGEGF